MKRDITLVKPREMLAFDGERCTPWVTTQILSAHLHRYFLTLDLVQGQRVLDISCGEGYGSALMFANGASEVTGVDIDTDLIARARRVYGTAGLTFKTADARAPLPFDDHSFDIIVSFETIEHIREHDGFVAELARVLSPNGTLVISTPDKAQSDPNQPNPFHERELGEDEFHDLLAEYFSHVTPHYQGLLHGSIVSGPDKASVTWKRTGFLEYTQDDTIQRRYIIATASNDKPRALPAGMLHDGAIVATLNRRIKALETQVKELEASGASLPEETDHA
ncbi:class I SAM-dependent methyltransferase [Rhodobacteraceae bacterium]|nr:class I SAM-dependent methyltransferase [Paracoccaceae bacterium]